MDVIRVGDKLISRDRIDKVLDKIFQMRNRGLSQQDVADRLGIDRTLISRLENIGEIRKGESIALIGFPVKNKDELEKIAYDAGVDFTYLLTDDERWSYVDKKDGASLLNDVMEIISRIKEYETIVFIGSDMRIRLIEAVLGRPIIGIEIGKSPIKEDVYVDPESVKNILAQINR